MRREGRNKWRQLQLLPFEQMESSDLVIEFNVNSFLEAVLAELNILYTFYLHILYRNFNAKFGVYSLHSCSD